MPEVINLADLFGQNLRRIYDAEQRLVKALPNLASAASSSELKQAFETHLTETEMHVARLQQVFELFGQDPDADTSESVKGIVKDGDNAIDLDADPSLKDAALIAAGQGAEHYEISAYGTLRTWAQLLGRRDAVELLDETLEEEKKADNLLTQIASSLNLRAATASARR